MLFKRFFLAVFFLLVAPVSSQDEVPEVGFFRLVNLVSPGEGKLNFSVDGESLYKKGYKLGQKTGGIGRKVGSYEIAAIKAGCIRGDRTLKLEKGSTQTLVAYAVPQRDDLGEIIAWEIELGRLKQSTPESGFTVTLVSFCEEKQLAVSVAVDGKKPTVQQLGQLKAQRVPVASVQGGIVVSVDGQDIASITPDDAGNYVVLIYDKGDGSKAAVSYYDPKFVVAG